MANERFQYYVEGQDDEKVINILRTKMGLIISGKVTVLNVVTKRITDLHLRTLSPGTTVVLVFDTDAGSRNILDENLRTLKSNKRVKEVIMAFLLSFGFYLYQQNKALNYQTE